MGCSKSSRQNWVHPAMIMCSIWCYRYVTYAVTLCITSYVGNISSSRGGSSTELRAIPDASGVHAVRIFIVLFTPPYVVICLLFLSPPVLTIAIQALHRTAENANVPQKLQDHITVRQQVRQEHFCQNTLNTLNMCAHKMPWALLYVPNLLLVPPYN